MVCSFSEMMARAYTFSISELLEGYFFSQILSTVESRPNFDPLFCNPSFIEHCLSFQLWYRQKIARPGELNNNWDSVEPSFFQHFDAAAKGLDLGTIPDDIIRYPPVNGSAQSNGLHYFE